MKNAPLLFYLKDTGTIPSSTLPLVVYPKVFTRREVDGAEWIEKKFASNKWSNAWRDSVYAYHHYHSITHEVLGVYQGEAMLLFGGDEGKEIHVQVGDVIIIPAGVSHKKIKEKDGFRVVGAYPNGMDYDIKRESPDEYKEALVNLASVPLPDSDPVVGQEGGICKFWRDDG